MTQFVRWYRQGRKTYNLSAIDAISYARDRALLWSSASPMWVVDVDDDGELLAYLFDDSGDEWTPLDCIGGVHQPFTVSDHGNVITDEESPYLIGIAADMVRGFQTQ